MASKNGINTEESTGDWIGPYNVVLAQNKSAIVTDPSPGDIIDQYTTKYVETPSTPCKLFAITIIPMLYCKHGNS